MWTLTVLTVLNFLNYVDRYVLSAVLEQVKQDPAFAGVSNARLGFLQTAFMLVYMVASLPAGALGRHLPRKYLVAAGVGIWSAATVASGLARDYPQMLWARAAIGFGEAGYATLAPAILSDLFSRRWRARVMALFYLATPVGSALGYILGGAVAARHGWRAAFFVAGGPGLLFAVLSLFTVEPERGAQEDAPAAPIPLLEALPQLLRGDYVRVTLGTALMTFSTGGLGFWMPSYLQEARHMDPAAANLVFGSLTVVAGIAGTVAGGLAGDAWKKRDPAAYTKLSAWGLAAAAPFAAAVPFVGSLPACFALTFVAELLIFLNTGPLNAALIDAAPAAIREVAVGLYILVLHALGDAVSPTILGWIVDALHARGMATERAAGVAVATTSVPLALAAVILLSGRRQRGDEIGSRH